MKWQRTWQIQGTKNIWTVGLAFDGSWGCSCPLWKFKRKQCHHIKQVRERLEIAVENRPEYVLANVNFPTLKENRLYIPLVRFDGNQTWMEATICCALIKAGYSWEEIKQLRQIPKSWTARAVVEYINMHGECRYPEVKDEKFVGGNAE